MQATILNKKGEKAGSIELAENMFNLPWNADLMHQVVVGMRANARVNIAHTKDRGEVRGGGKKPWQQKGTGRARHGSSRSPIWKGGGVTHGPRNEKNFEKKINRSMRQKALFIALSRKMRDGELIFVDSLEMQEPKTKIAQAILKALNITKKVNAALIALPSRHAPTIKSFRNFGNIEITPVADLNPVSVLGKRMVVIADPKTSIDWLSKKKIIKR